MNPLNSFDKNGKYSKNPRSELKQTNSGCKEDVVVSGSGNSNSLKRKRSESPEEGGFGPEEKRERVEYSDMEYSSEDEVSYDDNGSYEDEPSYDYEASSDVGGSSEVDDSSLKKEENLSQTSSVDNTEEKSSVVSDLIDIVKDIL